MPWGLIKGLWTLMSTGSLSEEVQWGVVFDEGNYNKKIEG